MATPVRIIERRGDDAVSLAHVQTGSSDTGPARPASSPTVEATWAGVRR
jgi:hypothetical protein